MAACRPLAVKSCGVTRGFMIDGRGMHILEPFRDVSGVLSGVPTFVQGGDGAGSRDDREPEGAG